MILRLQQEGARVSGVTETPGTKSAVEGTVTGGVLSFTSESQGTCSGTFSGTVVRETDGRERLRLEGENCNGTLEASCRGGVALSGVSSSPL